jgi:hypothetical protein
MLVYASEDRVALTRASRPCREKRLCTTTGRRWRFRSKVVRMPSTCRDRTRSPRTSRDNRPLAPPWARPARAAAEHPNALPGILPQTRATRGRRPHHPTNPAYALDRPRTVGLRQPRTPSAPGRRHCPISVPARTSHDSPRVAPPAGWATLSTRGLESHCSTPSPRRRGVSSPSSPMAGRPTRPPSDAGLSRAFAATPGTASGLSTRGLEVGFSRRPRRSVASLTGSHATPPRPRGRASRA